MVDEGGRQHAWQQADLVQQGDDLALAGSDAHRDTAQAHAAALLLLVVVVGLNAAAIAVRNRLRERARELAV